MADAKVGVIIEAQDNASQVLSGVAKKLNDLKPAFQTAALVGGAAFAGITAAIMTSVESANEAAKVQAQLGAVLASTHGAAGLYIEDLNDQAKALEHMTTYGDEAINSAQGLLLTFTNIKGGVFQQSIGTILDMSTALGTDLKSSAIQVGKALNDPINGISALQRVGVSFSESQKEVIKNLVLTGHTVEAQQLILKELNTEFGGSAAAAAQTYAGKMQQLGERFDDMKETIGNAVIPVLAKLVNVLVPLIDKFATWAEANPKLLALILGIAAATTGLITIVGVLGIALSGLAATATALGITMGVLLGWMLLIPLAIAAIIFIGYELYTHWSEIKAGAEVVWQAIVDTISAAWNGIVGAFNAGIAFVVGVWTGFTGMLSAAWEAVWNVIQTIVVDYIALTLGIIITALNYFIPNWQQYLQQIFQVISDTFQAIYTFVTGVWNATIDAVSNAFLIAGQWIVAQFATLKAAIQVALNAIADVWKSVWGGISDFFNSIWNALMDKVKSAVDFIAAQVAKLQALIAPVVNTISGAGSAVGSAFNSVMNTGKAALGIHDGIVQNGQIITTDPDDYIIATKNPSSLGGGRSINIQISGAVLTQEAARTIGDMILGELRLQLKM